MRRESHRRKGVARKASRMAGHRAVYVAAVLATAAMVTGFSGALLLYGPIGRGVPSRTISGSSTGVPPTGVLLGTDRTVIATALNLTGADGFATWNWTNSSGAYTGPCNASGILSPTNGSYSYYDTSTSGQNLSSGGGNVTLVCLNSVGPSPLWPYGGVLNATWYYNASGATLLTNSYDPLDMVGDGSTYNDGNVNISSCNAWGPASGWSPMWNETHLEDANFTPCSSYYEQNNNTTWVLSFAGQYGGIFASGLYVGMPIYNGTTLWAPDEMGFGPADVVYEVPVIFTNASVNGTYQISVDIGGVTPVAQTFYFNDTIGQTGAAADTVVFLFDMTAAWMMDLSFGMLGQPATTPAIYGAIGTVSTVVTECAPTGCPL